MKKLVMTLFLAFSVVIFANAQEAPKKPTSFTWNKAALTEIGCSADQMQKVAAVRKAYAEKKKTIDADATLDETAKKAAVKAALKERADASTALLTDEQKEKVKEINAKLKEEAKAAKAAASGE